MSSHPNSPHKYREIPERYKMREPEKVAGFYAKVLGYEAVRQNASDVWVFIIDPTHAVEFPITLDNSPVPKEVEFEYPTINFRVNDINRCAELIVLNGGIVTHAATAMNALGYFIHAQDPLKNPFGALQFNN